MATTEGSIILRAGRADVARARARTWRRRVIRLFLIFAIVDGYLWYRYATDNPISLSVPEGMASYLPAILLIVALSFLLVGQFVALSKSPHIKIRPEDIEIGLSQLKGLDAQAGEVQRTLDVFMGYATFRDELGGNPRRGSCSRDRPAPARRSWRRPWPRRPEVPVRLRRPRSARRSTG